MKSRALFIVLFCMILFSCEKENVEDSTSNDAQLALELKNEPETLTIDNSTYRLEAYLWRDFMPGPGQPENGTPLVSINNLINTDSLPIPDDIVLTRQYVVNGDEVWSAEYSEVMLKEKYILEGMSKNGPRWDAGTEVEVICEFVNEATGDTHRIMAKNQKIEATY
jgi:hypothetical protein